MFHIRYWSNGSQFDPPLSSHKTIEEAEAAVTCYGDRIYEDDIFIKSGKDVIEQRS
jgi:hypothetical protein